MSVHIQFDPDQEYQRDAIEAVLDLFTGQPLAPGEFELGTAEGTLFTIYGSGNNLVVSDETILENLKTVQDRNDIPEELRGGTDTAVSPRDFSVEMETGTGKTYVFLRTIIELNQRYGFNKFVIVVPSVPIREGTLSSLRLMQDHFAKIYNGATYGVTVYDSEDPARLRAFAKATNLQILIINIDAFNKKQMNRIYREGMDSMFGHRPIDLLSACNPVVVIDEPQNLESDISKEALSALNPLVTLRYSATHVNAYHQVYRLTPADAYELGLVKKIDVWSPETGDDLNNPFVKVTDVTALKRSVKAQLEVLVATDKGPKRKTIKAIAGQTDLGDETGIEAYEDWVVEEIATKPPAVYFTNGAFCEKGETLGQDRDAIQRTQIRDAVAEHFEKERQVHELVEAAAMEPTKVLTLFFIDKVANYHPDDGKFRRWFVEEYQRQASLPKNLHLEPPPVDAVHNGYFSVSKQGPKDTSGTTKADDLAYQLIMREKERLLSVDEPLRFIWSHSALREGWDNPNVFVICTLNETVSETKKRQEIGRGLRLPVTSSGERCKDPDVARLTVVPNESYEAFAASLQEEIEEETGQVFRSGGASNKRKNPNQPVPINDKALENPAFLELWEKIQRRTTYKVAFNTDELVEEAAARIRRKYESSTLKGAKVVSRKARIDMSNENGVTADFVSERAGAVSATTYKVPDLLRALTKSLPRVSRATIARILVESGQLGQVTRNPQQFIEDVRKAIDSVLNGMLVHGIIYTPIPDGSDGATYSMKLFTDRPIRANFASTYQVRNSEKTPYERVPYDSEDPEKKIAQALDVREDVRAFVKLPSWFTIDTPVGPYNPDWAYIKEERGQERLYLVRESKPTTDVEELRLNEQLKIDFAWRHYEVLEEVDYGVVDTATDV